MDSRAYKVGDKYYLDAETVAAYPQAANAVLYCEAAEDFGVWWPFISKTVEDEGMQCIIDTLSKCVKDDTIRHQFHTNDFRRYLMGRLGMT